MEERILSYLSEPTEEEQFILVQDRSMQRERYAKSGRFMIERRTVSEMSLGESTAAISMRKHPRFREFPSHSHDYIEMMYVCQGCITHVIKGKEVALKAHDLIILGRYTKHSILATGEPDIGINLIVSADLFESIYRRMTQGSELCHKTIESLMEKGGASHFVLSAENNLEIRNIFESMISSVICDNKPNGYILKSSLSLLIAYISSLSEDPSKVVDYKERQKRKLINYLEGSYSTATLTEAADMLGLSPSYLCRLVRSHFGSTFKELLMSIRFDAATELLSSTDLPIGEIISRVGYENSSYFHKEFKRRYGMTPINYRRSH